MTSIFRMGPPLLIALAVFAAYSNAMTGPFLFDDHVSIVKNMSIRRVIPLSKSLWGPQDTPTAGRPVANFSFALNYRAGGLNVYGYHLANVVLHVLNAILLFALIRRTLANSTWDQHWRDVATSVAFAVALPWALHPMQSESVTYVTQRTELLMALFFLVTLYSARREWDAKSHFARFSWHVICFVSCALGMASKETMVVAPVMVVLYDLTNFNRTFSELIGRRWHLYLSLTATWGVLAWLLASTPRSQSVGFGLSIKPLEYLTTQFWAIAHYIWLALWPTELCGDYGIFVVTKVGAWMPGFVLVALLTGLSVWAWYRCRILAFIGGWFLILLAPTTSIVPIVSEPVAERRMYLPLAAILVLFAIALIHVARQWSHGHTKQTRYSEFASRIRLATFTWILALVYAGTTYSRNQVFRNEAAFWTDVTLKRPMNSRGFNGLGLAYLQDKQLDEAIVAYQRAIELDPSNADAQMNLGNLFLMQERFDESRTHLELALQSNPKHAYAMMNLGVWNSVRGNFEEALDCFDKAHTIDPSLVEPIQRRGLIYFNRGRLDDAIQQYKLALEIDPDSFLTYNSMGTAYLATNQLDQAAESFRIAFRLDPQSSLACSNLGTALARQGEYQQAATCFENAIQLEPSLHDAMYNLGNCYALLNRPQEAITVYKKVLDTHPDDASAWFALGKSYVQTRQINEAKRCFERVLHWKPDAPEAQRELEQLGTK